MFTSIHLFIFNLMWHQARLQCLKIQVLLLWNNVARLAATSGCETSLPVCSTNMLSTCSFRNERGLSFSRPPRVVMEFSLGLQKEREKGRNWEREIKCMRGADGEC